MELAALERLKNRCHHVISVDIDPIVFKLAGNKDMHNIMNEFEFRPDRTTDYGVSCPWASKKYPYRPYNGKNGVSTFSLLFLIGSFWYFHVTRTSIKAWMSLNFLKWDLTLAHWTQVSDRCPLGYLLIESSSKLLVTMTGIKARTSLISGGIRLLTSELLALEWRKFYTSVVAVHSFKLEYLWSQLASLDQILYVASLGWEKGCIWFWGSLDQNSGFHGNRKPPLTYNGKNNVSTFSWLFLMWSFLYLQVTRTCIKSRMSSNFGQIGPLTIELAALECLKNFP